MASVQAIVYELSVMELRVEALDARTRSLCVSIDPSGAGRMQIALSHLQNLKDNIRYYGSRLQG